MLTILFIYYYILYIYLFLLYFSITGIIYDKVYENFVEEVDAVDNGIDVCEGEPR